MNVIINEAKLMREAIINNEPLNLMPLNIVILVLSGLSVFDISQMFLK